MSVCTVRRSVAAAVRAWLAARHVAIRGVAGAWDLSPPAGPELITGLEFLVYNYRPTVHTVRGAWSSERTRLCRRRQSPSLRCCQFAPPTQPAYSLNRQSFFLFF